MKIKFQMRLAQECDRSHLDGAGLPEHQGGSVLMARLSKPVKCHDRALDFYLAGINCLPLLIGRQMNRCQAHVWKNIGGRTCPGSSFA